MKMHVAVAKAVVQHCFPRWRPRWAFCKIRYKCKL